MEKNQKKKVIKAAMFGSLVGGVLGLMLAPKSGQELRQDIVEQAHHLGDKAVVIKDKAQVAWQNVEEKTQSTVDTGKSWVQKGKKLVSNFKTLVYEIQNGALTKTSSVEVLEVKDQCDSIDDIPIIENEHEFEFDDDKKLL